MSQKAPDFFRKPIWFSHRGYPRGGLENTRQSFDQAREMGFSGLETDIRITKDDHLVLCHDPSLQRLGGPSEPIWNIERKDLEKLELRDRGKVLFFDEFVASYRTCYWIFDVKPETAERVIPKLTAWLEGQPEELIREKMAFLFWQKDHEDLMRQRFPFANYFAREDECRKVGLAMLTGLGFLTSVVPGKCYAMPPRFYCMNLYKKRYVDFFHKRGAYVVAYLPTTTEEMAGAQKAGCDIALLDDPGLIIRESQHGAAERA